MARGNEQEPPGLPQRPLEASASTPPSGDLPNQITARRYLDRLWSFTETMVGFHLSSTLGRAGLAPEEARGRVSNVFRQVREMWDTTEADEVSDALDRTTLPIPPSTLVNLEEFGLTPEMLQRAREVARPITREDTPEAKERMGRALRQAIDKYPELFGRTRNDREAAAFHAFRRG